MENKNNLEMILVQKGTEAELRCYLNGKKDLLDLSFPGPEVQGDRLYAEFFESPFRMERRQCSFRGCLAVNLTSYLKAEDSPSLEELASYMEANCDAQYVLYAFVEDMASGSKLIHKMEDLTGCTKLCFRAKGEKQKQESSSKSKKFGY